MAVAAYCSTATAQKAPRDDRLSPSVAVAHADGKWTIAGQSLGHLIKNYRLRFHRGIRMQGSCPDEFGNVAPTKNFNPEHPLHPERLVRRTAVNVNGSWLEDSDCGRTNRTLILTKSKKILY
jgi:hypothetical protein